MNKCLPKNRAKWQRVTTPLTTPKEREGLSCIEEFLNEYVALAEAERATNTQLDELVEKSKKRIDKATEVGWKTMQLWQEDRLYDIAKDLIDAMDMREEWTPQDIMGHLPRIERAINMVKDGLKYLEGLEAVKDKLVAPKTRLEKLTAIETFVSTTHAGKGPILTHGCDLVGYWGVDDAIRDVLNCLAGEE